MNLGDLNHLQEGISFAAQLGVEMWRLRQQEDENFQGSLGCVGKACLIQYLFPRAV